MGLGRTSARDKIATLSAGCSIRRPRTVVWLPYVLVTCVLLASGALTLAVSLSANDGNLVYALDDAYIHMAIAKNLSQHGVWGVTPDEFAGASSSPLFTLLLSVVYFVTGVHDATPMILNSIAAVLLLVVVGRILKSYGYPTWVAAGLSLVAAMLMPVKAIVFGGMEHVLHATATVLFAALAARTITRGQRTGQRDRMILIALAAAVVGLRYEGLALVLTAALLLVIRRDNLTAAGLVLAGAVPILIYGAASVAQGSFFLPNSLLLKAAPFAFREIAASLAEGYPLTMQSLSRLAFGDFLALERPEVTHIAALAASAVVLLAMAARRGRLWRSEAVLLLLALVALIAQTRLARLGSFYRYEAYAVLLLTVAIMCAASVQFHWLHYVKEHGGPSEAESAKRAVIVVVCIALLASVPLLTRAVRAESEVVQATHNIYSQQYQMGRFLQQHWPGARVAANDIGAISYYGDIELLDLVGLASAEVTGIRRRQGGLTSADLSRLTQQRSSQLTIVYESWFAGVIPLDWRKAGEWTVSAQIVLSDKTVSFFAVDSSPETAVRLVQTLSVYDERLPDGVASRLATPSSP